MIFRNRDLRLPTRLSEAVSLLQTLWSRRHSTGHGEAAPEPAHNCRPKLLPGSLPGDAVAAETSPHLLITKPPRFSGTESSPSSLSRSGDKCLGAYLSGCLHRGAQGRQAPFRILSSDEHSLPSSPDCPVGHPRQSEPGARSPHAQRLG